MPTLGLAMIVKNEIRTIERCLHSVMPYIDHWTICDTGSTDETQGIIRYVLSSKPGQLHEVPWVSFGRNRSQALAIARDQADYTLMFDADLELQVTDQNWRDQLTCDSHELRYSGALDYTNNRIFSAQHLWRYIGATHEYPWSNTAVTLGQVTGVSMLDHADGGSRAHKFKRDVLLLTEELIEDRSNARSAFYLAQSYRDLGQYAEALHWYTERAKMPGFLEETWYARYQQAEMMEKLGMPRQQLIDAYVGAYRMRPTRIEPLYKLASMLHRAGDDELALVYASVWLTGFAYPTDRLFIDAPIYHRLMPDLVTTLRAKPRVI